MKNLPPSPNLSHLRKQAKQLLSDARTGSEAALQRFAANLPAVRAMGLTALANQALKLHDAQFVIAREFGFRSWLEIKRFIAWKQIDRAQRVTLWLGWVYEGGTRERQLAVRTLHEQLDTFASDMWVAYATGDESAIRRALSAGSDWANRAGGPFSMPPLVAVTHSLLILEQGFEAPLLACAQLLLERGADVNGKRIDPKFPDSPLSALYGAAGRTHSPAMTKLLLDAGADPNDGESLYHSLESRDSRCTRLLLAAGVRVSGTNAIARAFDFDKLDDVRLMLEQGGAANERPWMHHAILRGRSLQAIRILADAGADLRASNREGISLYRWAQLHGRQDVVDLLEKAGIEEALTKEEQFLAACTRGDEENARAIASRTPDVVARLTNEQLRALPEQADVGNIRAVGTMLELGWPREAKAAWQATALHLAVYRGDAPMATLLLKHGADWQTLNGFGGNVISTLSHASQNDVEDPLAPRDYLGCARLLVLHGVPLPEATVRFSPEVTEYFDTERLRGRA